MPYATRKMVKYMKEKGLSSSGESSDEAVSSGENDKKIRELPSSVDPVEDEPQGDKASPKSPGGVKQVSKTSNKSKKKTKSKTKSKSAKLRNKSLVKSSTGKVKGKPRSAKSSKSTKKGGAAAAAGKVKMIPATEMALKPLQVKGVNYGEMTFDEKKVQFIAALLKSNVRKLKEMDATESSEEGKKAFNMYSIGEKKPLESGAKPHSAKALYLCTHKSFPPDVQVIAKLYDPKTYDPKSSLFLKVLRHLGKKHPNVIQTWDVIHHDGSIYVFQELAPYGSMAEHLKKKGSQLSEEECQLVACQLRTGMDFLGDMGVSHRAICPRHLLLLHKDLRVKLTGFRSAVIYYNEKKDDIAFQPCLSVKKKCKEGTEDYNAPEMYGNSKKEQFDPVQADIWSAGATLFNLLTGKFPYDCLKNSPKVENEIQSNIRSLKLSDNGKSALGYMLTTESTKRFSTERLKDHPWFHEK